MTLGVTANIEELIALERYAKLSPPITPARASQMGTHLAKFYGRGMDFAEIRNYQAGDEIRHMEWRVTARTGKPHIKLYQEEREQPVVLVTDFSNTMFFGTRVAFKSVLAARLAAMIAWRTAKQGDCVGGIFFQGTKHNEYSPRARKAGVLTLIHALAEYTALIMDSHASTENANTHALAHALKRLSRVARPGSILVLISDFYALDEQCVELLTRLRPHNTILAYQVCDPLELAPPRANQYPIAQEGKTIFFDTQNPALASAYEHYCTTRMETLKRTLTHLKIPLVRLTGEDDIARLVAETFPRKRYG